MTQIPIAEQFYSVQGEGPYAGDPSVFLRLSGCNLTCGGTHNRQVENQEDMTPSEDATWVCDTISVWREVSEKMNARELAQKWEDEGWLEKLQDRAHLILTGGEPTIPSRQNELSVILESLRNWDIDPFVEVETNGTYKPQSAFDAQVDHYNVSLKLRNSGMAREDRINPDAIKWYKWRFEAGDVGDAIFKFVVSRDEDIPEIKGLISEYDLPDDMIWLMPAGANQEQLRETYPVTAELCKENGWRFSPRLQVDVWNEATGV